MSVQRQITGNDQLDSDLETLFSLVRDEKRLAAAKAAISDQSCSWQKLQESIPPSVFRLASTFLGDESVETQINELDSTDEREVLSNALAQMKAHFNGLEQHPAVADVLRRELARLEEKTERPDDGENRVTGVEWDLAWAENDDKVSPLVHVRLRDESDGLILRSTMDWDDIAFLVGAFCRLLSLHMKRSKPIADAELLALPNSEKIAERLSEAVTAIQEIAELGEAYGIRVRSCTVGNAKAP